MNQVTIGELVEDLIPHTEKGNKVVPVTIVPRKIVEDIIQFCEDDIKRFDKKLDDPALSDRNAQRTLAKREYAYQLMNFACGKLLEFEGVSE